MQHKKTKSIHSLKWATLLVTGLFAHQSAYALGLGDIQIKSHLGQPFKAQIKVYGATDIKGDVGCFSLNKDNASFLGNTHLKLTQLNPDEAILTITSAQAVNEPIVNLSVSTTCDSEMRRDYVLLLDPALSNETEDITVAEESTSATTENSLDIASPKVKKHSRTISKKTSDAGYKINKNKTLVNHDGATDGLTTVFANASSRATNPSTGGNSKPSRPSLSISGGTYEALPAQALSLHMDRRLEMRPNAADPIPAGDLEMLDELTAMNNRLKHLQTQISQLQQSNLKLTQDNAQKNKALTLNQTELTQFKQFGFGLGALLLLLSGHLGWGWWQRRRTHLSVLDRILQDQQDEIPLDEALFENETSRQQIDNAVENSTSEAENFGVSVIDADPILVEEADPSMSVLDHADVFLSHGRTELAIQLLQSHLLEHPKQSVTIWLFLLDLLAKQNLHALYEQTALDCKDHFNVNIPGFDTKPTATAHTLEAYPNLSAGLQTVWGTPAALTYLDDLIYNNRLEPRVGFDKQLIEELLALKSVAQERANSAEVIQLDEKKLALKGRKEAQLAAKKAEKLQQIEEIAKASEAAQQAELAKEQETKFDFGLIEWK